MPGDAPVVGVIAEGEGHARIEVDGAARRLERSVAVVGGGEGLEDGALEDPVDGPVIGDEPVEGLALHRLHGQEVDAVAFLDGMDGDDAWVVEGTEGLRLAPEGSSRSGRDAMSAGSSLRATSRPSFVSVAR